MKYSLSIIFLFCFLKKNFCQQIEIPNTFNKVMELNGDLDKDGIDEIVQVYNTNEKDERTGYKRILYILKYKNGKKTIFKKNSSILRDSKDCGFCNIYDNSDPILEIKIKNSTLIIKQRFLNNSRKTEDSKLIFRYQDSDWFLIGSTYQHYDTCDFDNTYDINFSINKVNITKETSSCDEYDATKENHVFKSYKYKFEKITLDSYKQTEKEIQKDVFVYY